MVRIIWRVLEAHSLLENHVISEASLGVLQKIKCSSDVLHIKYDCVVLFLDKCIG